MSNADLVEQAVHETLTYYGLDTTAQWSTQRYMSMRLYQAKQTKTEVNAA